MLANSAINVIQAKSLAVTHEEKTSTPPSGGTGTGGVPGTSCERGVNRLAMTSRWVKGMLDQITNL